MVENKTIKELWDEYREAKMYKGTWTIIETFSIYSNPKEAMIKTKLYHDDFYAKKPPNGSMYWMLQIDPPMWFLYEIGAKK